MTEKQQPHHTDPLIDEVREIRARLWAQDGEDLDRAAAELRRIEHRYRDRVRTPPPRNSNDRRTA